MVGFNEIDFKHQYKRLLYSNCDLNSNNNDGNLLVNLFCGSLSNNINANRDLNDIIDQTKERLKNKMSYCKRKIYDVIHTFYACDKYLALV